jgi:hypothetical protein
MSTPQIQSFLPTLEQMFGYTIPQKEGISKNTRGTPQTSLTVAHSPLAGCQRAKAGDMMSIISANRFCS